MKQKITHYEKHPVIVVLVTVALVSCEKEKEAVELTWRKNAI